MHRTTFNFQPLADLRFASSGGWTRSEPVEFTASSSKLDSELLRCTCPACTGKGLPVDPQGTGDARHDPGALVVHDNMPHELPSSSFGATADVILGFAHEAPAQTFDGLFGAF